MTREFQSILFSYIVLYMNVWAELTENFYILQTDFNDFHITSGNISDIITTSQIDCATYCSGNPFCRSISFHLEKSECVLFSDCFICKSGYNEIGWKYYCSEEGKTYAAFYAVVTFAVAAQTDPVIFDKVFTNIGESYNNASGKFTSRENGIFVFSWTIGASSTTLESTLRRNNAVIGYLRADPGGISEQDTSTNIVAIELSAGDTVEVYIDAGTALPWSSSFSGWEMPWSEDTAVFHSAANFHQSPNALINFDYVLSNVGNSYETTERAAVVKTPGYYFYASVTEANAGWYDYIQLMINNNQEFVTEMDGRPGQFDTSTMVYMKMMSKNDSVSILNGNAAVMPVKTTFTGFRFPQQCEDLPKFSVRLSSTSTGKLVFDDVFLNTGNAYNTSTGEFTATVQGIYVILWSVRSTRDTGKEVISKLFVNHILTGVIVSDANENLVHNCRDNTMGVTVLELNIGDRIYVVTTGFASAPQTTFNGFFMGRNMENP